MYPFDKFKRLLSIHVFRDLIFDFFLIEFFFHVRAEILVSWQGGGVSENPIVSILRSYGKKLFFVLFLALASNT